MTTDWFEKMKKDFEEKLLFWDNCDSYRFNKQHSIIRDCVIRAIDEWEKNEITICCSDDQIKKIRGLSLWVSYELSYYVFTNKPIKAERIAQSLNANFSEQDDREFSAKVFEKIAERIFDFLSESLPKESMTTLPEALWDMEEYNSVCPSFNAAENMRVCIEYYQFDTIIEGKIVSVKELKQMFKKAIAIRKNQIVKDEGYTCKQLNKLAKKHTKLHRQQKVLSAAEQGAYDRMLAASEKAYGDFAELFCKLYDYKIIKVIPYIGMCAEMYKYTLDIDTDIVLERVGG